MAVKTFTQGEKLTTADTNTYLNNGGLVYITGATATSGTTLGINSCFNSTYDNYKIIVSGFAGASTAIGLQIKLRASGTPSSTGYYYTGFFTQYGVSTTQYETAANNSIYQIGCVGDVNLYGGAEITLYGPNFARNTGIASQGIDPRTAGGGCRIYSGYHSVATAYDGFELIASNTLSALTARVYGIRQA